MSLLKQLSVLILALTVTLSTHEAMAQQVAKKNKGRSEGRTGVRTREISSESVGAVSTVEATPLEATAAAAVAIGGGSTLPGLTFSVGAMVAREVHLYVGGDFGMFFTTGPFAMIFTVFPSAYFKIPAAPKFTPRIGLSLGPVFSTGGGLSAVRFGLLFKPGIDVMLSNKIALNFEGRLGVFDSSFVFIPQLGATFTL